jgi:hypothetical protein
MPAKSVAMRRAAAIAEHHPEELNAENKGLLKMTQGELHKFASTPEKGLPQHTKTSLKSLYKKGKARKG